jgi:hypothetical protein
MIGRSCECRAQSCNQNYTVAPGLWPAVDLALIHLREGERDDYCQAEVSWYVDAGRMLRALVFAGRPERARLGGL